MKNWFSLLFVLLAFNGVSQDVPDTNNYREGAPKVFIGCDDCDIQYLKNEINFLNFMRDRRLADVIVLYRKIDTGNGGKEYTLTFTGENIYKGVETVEKFNSIPNMSDGDIRSGLKDVLIRGMLIYLIKSPLAEKINYTIDGFDKESEVLQVKDKWNLWLCNISGGVDGGGQEYSKNLSFNSSFSANRTSEKNKFEVGYFLFGNQQKYNLNDTTKITSNTISYGLYSYDAISLGKHFAVGYFTNTFSSTVQNLQNSITIFPSLEYNVFSYSEATRRQLRFNYRIGYRYVNFFDLTYLDKLRDDYFLQSLVISFKQVEKWGRINFDVGTFQYFDKHNFYRINLSPSISCNIAKGLNLNFGGNFSIVNDQYYLRKDEVSTEYILLGQSQLKSAFSYSLSVGLNYSFGSIYNNIVNVRFGMSEDNW